MLRLILLFLAFFQFVNNAQAQDRSMLLGEEIAEQTSASNSKDDIKEDKGIFSFLNFIGRKSPSEIKVEEGAKESVLEKLIRTANEGTLDSQLNWGYIYLYGVEQINENIDYTKAFI